MSNTRSSSSQLDPEAGRVFAEMYEKFEPSKDWANAMMWSFPVAKGISPEEVKRSLNSLAYERNLFFAGEAPFHKQAEAATGKPYRYTNFMSFCDVRVGMMMIDYNDKYSAYMPCRIAIVEDKSGPGLAAFDESRPDDLRRKTPAAGNERAGAQGTQHALRNHEGRRRRRLLTDRPRPPHNA